MITVQIEKSLIENSLSKDKQISHYSTQLILFKCAEVAGIL